MRKRRLDRESVRLPEIPPCSALSKPFAEVGDVIKFVESDFLGIVEGRIAECDTEDTCTGKNCIGFLEVRAFNGSTECFRWVNPKDVLSCIDGKVFREAVSFWLERKPGMIAYGNHYDYEKGGLQ